MTVDELVAGIRSGDEEARTETWQAAPALGAAAVAPLAELGTDSSVEVARAAMRGLWAITRDAGRPNADAKRAEVVAALTPFTGPGHAEQLRRDVIWMLSEIGDDATVPVLAALLSDEVLREDARMALERIPGEASLAALRAGLEAAPGDFKPNIAHSLRARGEAVEGIPDTKLAPEHATSVTRDRGER
jgi:HEAT repeat protein